jgi:hypothetical protein
VQVRDSSWSTAISATLHCLTGCAIGEVLGMVLSTWWGWGNAGSIVLSVVLAFFFGYLLTFTSLRRHGASVRDGARLALASDTVSITSMEIVDNLIVLVIPGAMTAALATSLFWGAWRSRWRSPSSSPCPSTAGSSRAGRAMPSYTPCTSTDPRGRASLS